MFDQDNNIAPCVDFVSAGNDNQGAAVQARTADHNNVMINTFHMAGPNLIGTGNIAVTARATGEYGRIL